jgi:ATP-dependent exoDNAse (exonuclease V) beta subunit
MEFRIADTFTESLARLTGDEQKAVETTAFDLQEVYDTELHLLSVACTRARDHLLVTGVSPVSEFLDDFTEGGAGPGG